MKKLLVAAISALALVFAALSPASAITYGQLDAGEHPYVGFMIFFDPNEPGWFSCSGTLLDGNTFLTAGHCTFGIGTNGAAAGNSGGNDVWVTFADTMVLAGWPARTPGIAEDVLYAQRSAWLNDPAHGFMRGTSHPHPQYDNFAQFPANFDVGVVELSSSVSVGGFGVLAPLGTVEQMAGRTGKFRNDALIETVGYGIQSVQPKPQDEETRYKSTSRIVEVNGNSSKGGNVHTLNNPSAPGGTGGSCFGDSGGPLFVNNTNQVVAVVSYGNSSTCHGADYSWRVDTQNSYNFVNSFLV